MINITNKKKNFMVWVCKWCSLSLLFIDGMNSIWIICGVINFEHIKEKSKIIAIIFLNIVDYFPCRIIMWGMKRPTVKPLTTSTSIHINITTIIIIITPWSQSTTTKRNELITNTNNEPGIFISILVHFWTLITFART